MDEIRLLLKTIRTVGKGNPVTYIQLSEIIRRLWRPRAKVYSVYQAAHGFIPGDVIKPADPLWVKARANTEANAKATAVVCDIIDEDNFIFLQEGIIPGDYIIGKTYFLSITTAGAVFVQTNPEVWSIGNYRQMIGTGTADGLLVEIDEGKVWEGPTNITNIVNNTYNEITNITNNNTTIVYLGQNPAASSVRVYLNGIRQHYSTYTVNGNTVTLNEAPYPGDVVQVFYEAWKADVAITEIPSGDINDVNTVFTMTEIPEPTSLNAFLNGVLLHASKYTIYGDTITLLEAPFTGDTLLVDYITSSDSGRAYNETPAGAINDVNVDFTLARAPTDEKAKVYLNGVRQIPTTHYTISGSVITFLIAPFTNDQIICDYEY